MMSCSELFGTPREWAQDLALATGLGVLLGVLGPFGSFYGGPLEARLFYWTANLWIGFTLVSVGVRLSLKAGQRLDLPVWFALPAGAAIAALPLSIIVDLFSAHFWPGRHGRLAPLLEVYGQTLVITEPCALLFYMKQAQRPPMPAARSSEALPAAAPPPAQALREPIAPGRLGGPGRVRRDLLCLQMEDHYVRVHTAAGSELVLLTFKEALEELRGVEGLQVHRSWWVARAAVAGAVRDGRNLRLRLANGLEAPVSRGSLASLREAGWLEKDALEA